MEVEVKPLGQTVIETGNSAQDSNKEYQGLQQQFCFTSRLCFA
jgi:hypothetical protein